MNPPNRLFVLAVLSVLACTPAAAQNAQRLSLQEAEQIAVQNHPRFRARPIWHLRPKLR